MSSFRAVKMPFLAGKRAKPGDGKGGATLIVVEGNYPIDFLIHNDRNYVSEDEAFEAADRMIDRWEGSLVSR